MAETKTQPNGRSSSSSVVVVDGREVAVMESPGVPFIHSVFAFAMWVGCIHLFFAAIFVAIFLLPLSKSFMVFALLYVLTVLPVEADGSIGLRLRRYVFKNVCGYFPITVHVEDLKAFVPNRAYIFAYEPHSVLPLGLISLLHLTHIVPLPKTKVLSSTAVFKTPFMRHVWTWMSIAAVTKENFTSLLRAGYSCVVVPGGARETLHMVHDYEIAFLKTRKGFIRTAIETGAPLIPVFCFGQSKFYNWWRPTGKLFLRICRVMRFTPMLFWGVWGTPLPCRVPLHVVVGKPIEVARNTQPTTEEVDELHRQFVEAIEGLFERHKARVGYPDLKLKLI